MSLGRILGRPLHALACGGKQEDPFDLINEHIKLQKQGNPLYPFHDSTLKSRLASLENNIVGEDVMVGSIMIDKSKIVRIYSD
jgi:hypothetical protein